MVKKSDQSRHAPCILCCWGKACVDAWPTCGGAIGEAGGHGLRAMRVQLRTWLATIYDQRRGSEVPRDEFDGKELKLSVRKILKPKKSMERDFLALAAA